jgi:hypothetical protein
MSMETIANALKGVLDLVFKIIGFYPEIVLAPKMILYADCSDLNTSPIELVNVATYKSHDLVGGGPGWAEASKTALLTLCDSPRCDSRRRISEILQVDC